MHIHVRTCTCLDSGAHAVIETALRAYVRADSYTFARCGSYIDSLNAYFVWVLAYI